MEPLPSCGRMYTMDKKATDAEIKMRYQYSVRVLKTCVDAPDKVKEAAEILRELAEGGYVEAQCSLGDFFSQGCYIEPEGEGQRNVPDGCSYGESFSYTSIRKLPQAGNWRRKRLSGGNDVVSPVGGASK